MFLKVTVFIVVFFTLVSHPILCSSLSIIRHWAVSLKLSTKRQGLASKLLTWLGDVWKTKNEGCVLKNNRNSIILIKIYWTGLMWKNIVTYRSWQHITVSTKDTFIIKITWFVMFIQILLFSITENQIRYTAVRVASFFSFFFFLTVFWSVSVT